MKLIIFSLILVPLTACSPFTETRIVREVEYQTCPPQYIENVCGEVDGSPKKAKVWGGESMAKIDYWEQAACYASLYKEGFDLHKLCKETWEK